MKFESINADMYRVMLEQDDKNKIEEAVKILDNGITKWQEFYNDKFMDTVVCRYVTAEFYKQHKDVLTQRAGFVTVDIGYDERVITISIGLWSMTKDMELEIMSGVLYT